MPGQENPQGCTTPSETPEVKQRMPRLIRSGPVAAPVWLLALLPMLLASALVIPRLNTDAYNGDEPDTMKTAGIRQDEPRYLAEVWSNTAPRVAPGWAGLISVWARVAGWSELAIRSLATFAGLLTIALVFRSGSVFFSPIAGFLAALLLGTSVFFLAYMLRAGTYAGVALFATLAVWSYWKIAHTSRTPLILAQGALLLGSAGLVFTHYLASLILVPLGVLHLFFVPKGRSWWNTTLVFALAALAGVIQLPLLLKGLDFTEIEDKGSRILSAPALIYELLGGLSNGILAASTPAQKALALGLFLFLLACLLRRLRRKGGNEPYSYLGLVLVSFLVLVASANELLKIIVDNRIRYLMPFWPLAALLAGAAMALHLRRKRLAVTLVLVIWLCLGCGLPIATNYHYQTGFFFRSDLHRIAAILPALVPEEDGLVVSLDGAWEGVRYEAWMAQAGKLKFPFEMYLSDPEEALTTLVSARPSHPSVWLLRQQDSVAFSSGQAIEAGLVLCRQVQDRWGYSLERYAGTEAPCPG